MKRDLFMVEEEQKHELFIDADSGFGNDRNSYDTLILNQMNACIKVLSREMTGGQIVYKESTGGTEKYIEDVRELVINHVDALKMLLVFYIEGTNKDNLNVLIKAIEDYKTEIGKQEIFLPGKGKVKLSNIKGLPVSNPYWRDFINFKALKYRDVFEVLVQAYNKHKNDIKSMEEE